MRTEIRNNGVEDVTVLIADEGKVLQRKTSKEIVGEELWLGKSYYIGGVLQDPPHLDVPEDFEEVDKPEDWPPEPEPTEEPEILDKQALNIILNGE